MAQNVTLWGADYPSVPQITVPKTGGGTADFTDVSDTTATASEVLAGYTFHDAAGAAVNGSVVIQHYYTGSAAPSASLGEDGDIYLQIGG